jgi:hypothetical protein
MSNTWIGYTLVLEREPDFSAAEKELEKIKSLLEPLLVAMDAAVENDDEERDRLFAVLDDLAGAFDEELVSVADDVRALVTCAEVALSDAKIQWPPLHNDGDFVYVGDKIVVFAGDSTDGSSPEGAGYELLRGLSMFKSVYAALQRESA